MDWIEVMMNLLLLTSTSDILIEYLLLQKSYKKNDETDLIIVI